MDAVLNARSSLRSIVRTYSEEQEHDATTYIFSISKLIKLECGSARFPSDGMFRVIPFAEEALV